MKKTLDYTITRDVLYAIEEKELYELLMYTDRDRKELEVAEKIYWWCIDEINRRVECGEIQEFDN